MPLHCTCGAQLPEDARFCHKCGKPQRDEPLLVEEAPPPPVAPLAPPAPQFPPIGFRNRFAVRAALISGMLVVAALLFSSQLGVPAASSAGLTGGLLAAGFLAVFLYERRTGQRLSMIRGAHLGWISGIFGFSFMALMLSAMMAALSNPEMVNAIKEQWKTSSYHQVDIDQMIQALHTPSMMLPALAAAFVMLTVLPACGGALGAKLLDRHE